MTQQLIFDGLWNATSYFCVWWSIRAYVCVHLRREKVIFLSPFGRFRISFSHSFKARILWKSKNKVPKKKKKVVHVIDGIVFQKDQTDVLNKPRVYVVGRRKSERRIKRPPEKRLPLPDERHLRKLFLITGMTNVHHLMNVMSFFFWRQMVLLVVYKFYFERASWETESRIQVSSVSTFDYQ